MAQIIICMECGTPLMELNEPCPNCMPSIAWRMPTIKSCHECKKLRDKLTAVKMRLNDYEPGCEMCEDLKNDIESILNII